MAYKAINNAYATLAVAMNATDTIAQVATGKGDLFPVITGTDHTYISFENAAGAEEVMKVTARALGSDSMTVVRGQDGTSAKSWIVGDIVECRPCAAVISDLQGEFAAADAAIVASSIAVTPVGGIASTNVQAALAELDTEKQAAGSYAALAGSSTQTFNVANATASTMAVNKGQADAAYQPAGSYQPALGYTPVQQGTGPRQLTNVVKLGWSGSRIAMGVDATDQGDIANTGDINNLQNQINGLSFVSKDQNYNAVGSFCWAGVSGSSVSTGATIAGALLYPASVVDNATNISNASLPGTWRCLGNSLTPSGTSIASTLFQRIA